MMRKKSLPRLLTVFSLFVFFYACKKQDLYPTTPPVETFKQVVSEWQRQVDLTNSLSQKTRQHCDTLLAHLDYATAIKINKSDTTALYLIKIDLPAKYRNTKYLVIEVHHHTYSLDGVYEAKDLGKIQTFYATKQIAGRDSILVWDINGYPLKGWERTIDGKMRDRYGKWRVHAPVPAHVDSMGPLVKKINVEAPPPEGEECTDWYWVIRDSETGEIISETYQFSTGNCTNSGGGSGGTGQGVAQEVSPPVYWPGPSPIPDIRKYLECFSASGTNCKVSVLVKQPVPGSPDVYSASDVGHTFLVFTQTLPNGTTIQRNVGFYPTGLVTPFNKSKDGEYDNDEYSEFNVGVEISVSSANFIKMINAIEASPPGYNLNSANCTTWALGLLDKGGVNLSSQVPISTASFLGLPAFNGYCPGGLGQTLLNMPLPNLNNGMFNVSPFMLHDNSGSCQ